MTPLIRANLLVLGLLIVHTLDHAVNQPARDLPVTGSLVAVVGFAIVAGAAVLALNRSRFAVAASSLAGLLTAAGILAIHLAPRWSEPLSDPYWEFDPNALSWILLIAPLAAALYLAYVAMRGSSGSRQPPLSAARGSEYAGVGGNQRQHPPQRP